MSAAEPEYLTVSALTKYIARKFEADPYLGRLFVTGEVSNFRRRPGNQYFSLKDDTAKINAMMFARAFAQVPFDLQEGMKVDAVGRVAVYQRSGEYQLYVDQLQPAGEGDLYLRLEALKKKLSAEGLFAQTKRPLPRFPKRIGVITSQSGAVIHDIETTVARRYPLAQVILFPAVVQGEAAAGSLVERLQQAYLYPGLDVLIIGRGGGSIEDLWPFNEESVARTLVESPIPVISSVGHETDTTIADLVADVRAATPTAAAELATPDTVTDLLAAIRQDAATMTRTVARQLGDARNRLDQLANAPVLHQPERLYAAQAQQLDNLQQRLLHAWQTQDSGSRNVLAGLVNRLWRQTPQNRVALAAQQLTNLQQRLTTAQRQRLTHDREAVRTAVHALDLLSPLKVLDRGYTYVADDTTGAVLPQVSALHPSQKVTIHFSDGTAAAQITETKKGTAHGHEDE